MQSAAAERLSSSASQPTALPAWCGQRETPGGLRAPRPPCPEHRAARRAALPVLLLRHAARLAPRLPPLRGQTEPCQPLRTGTGGSCSARQRFANTRPFHPGPLCAKGSSSSTFLAEIRLATVHLVPTPRIFLTLSYSQPRSHLLDFHFCNSGLFTKGLQRFWRKL